MIPLQLLLLQITTIFIFNNIPTTNASSIIERSTQFNCEIPSNGCTNGMFNQAKCECECIPPFCPDQNGNCFVASGCTNPWKDCTKGINCPWWSLGGDSESCTTGPKVPDGYWTIFNTERICCNKNFPYSTICAVDQTSSPTKHPTISIPNESEYEVIPIKFDVMGLPSDLNNREMDELHEEMGTVLKRILLRLSDRISGMKVSNVEQKILQQRQRGLLRTTTSSIGMIVTDIVKDITTQYQTRRRLEQDITLYFNVYVVRDYDKKFGPLVIQEIRDSYEEVLEQIQTFADTKYFGANLNLNWCTVKNGKYDLCVKDLNNGSSGARPLSQMPSQTYDKTSSNNSEEGLAGWAIGLIVIIALIVLGCAGYWIAVVCFGVTNCFRYNHENDIQSHIYFDDNQSQFDVVSRYGSRGTRRSDESTINNNRRIGKDPTFYLPGQYDKPDPDALRLTDGSSRSSGRSSRGSASRNGRRRYYEEDNSAPIRPKREPTMYVDGEATIDEEYSVDYPASLKSASRQTKPNRSYYNDENRGGIHSVLDENESYRTEEYEAPPSRRGRDYYDEGDASFLTEDPSYATRSEARSKKKSSRSSRRSDREDYY